MSEARVTTVAILDADPHALASKTAAFSGVHGTAVLIAAESLGKLLTDPAFPTDVVILEQRSGERVSVNYKIRVCRLSEARVIVIARDDLGLAPDVSVLMTPVTTFAAAVDLLTRVGARP